MDTINGFPHLSLGMILFLVLVAFWDALWKLAAFWRSARNGHIVWFICIAIFNTVGILPIIYLLTHKRRDIND